MVRYKKLIFLGILLLTTFSPIVLAASSSLVRGRVFGLVSNQRSVSVILFFILFLSIWGISAKKVAQFRGWGKSLKNAVTALASVMAASSTVGLDYLQTNKWRGYYLIYELGWVWILVAIALILLLIAGIFYRSGGEKIEGLTTFLTALGIIILYKVLEVFVPNFVDRLGGWGWIIDVLYYLASAVLILMILLYLWNNLFSDLKVRMPNWRGGSSSAPATQNPESPGRSNPQRPTPARSTSARSTSARSTPARTPTPRPAPSGTPPRGGSTNSNYLPVMGLWQVSPAQVNSMVSQAIRAGYVEFDSSDNYMNEERFARAIRSFSVKTVYTKIDPDNFDSITNSVQQAQGLFPRVDRLIIMLHWPGEANIGGQVEWPGANGFVAYRELAQLVERPSVSNFGVVHLQEISKIKKPYLNQIEINPLLQQTEIIEYCQRNKIKVQAFSPLASGRLDRNRIVRNIASQYRKSVAQVLIRYAYQKGADIVNVKSTNPQRMRENLDINDFQLSQRDMAQLDSLRDDLSFPLGTSESAPSPQVFPPFPSLGGNPPSGGPPPGTPPLTGLGYYLRRRLRRIKRAGDNLINTP